MASLVGSSQTVTGAAQGSGSICAYCHVQYQMNPAGWRTPTTYAYTVIEFIAALVISFSILVAVERPWLNNRRRRSKLLIWTFGVSGVSSVLSIVITIADIIQHQKGATVTYSYWIIYIFSSFAARLADVLLSGFVLGVVLGLRAERHDRHTKILAMVYATMCFVQAVMSITGLAYFISDVAQFLNTGVSTNTISKATETVYDIVQFLAALEVVIFTTSFYIFDTISERENGILAVIAFFYFTYSLTKLVGVQIINYDTSNDPVAATWAYGFIQLFAYMAIFVSLALLSKCDWEKVYGKPARTKGRYDYTVDYSPPSDMKLDEPESYKEDILAVLPSIKTGDWRFNQTYVPISQQQHDAANRTRKSWLDLD